VIASAGIVVPAHNEEALLPGCLAALRVAAQAVRPVPVRICVVADACTDQTAEIARQFGAEVITIRERNVGAARAAGMAATLSHFAGQPPERVWLASTDADTRVPASWLTRQVAYAAAGWDVVLGTVIVTDWHDHPPHLPATFAARYAFGDGSHPHVHGANLGCRASAYLKAGGFRPLATAEDHDLLRALSRNGCAIARSPDMPVTTSSRRSGRAPAGFSQLLTGLAAQLGPSCPAPGPS
jgi:glycosyltransferase involved in cell wall biosynthesis